MIGRFFRWLRAQHLAASIVDYEKDLADIRDLKAHCEKAEAEILERLSRDQVALYHVTRKGNV